jgi:sterol desaturase/sphingolipid hydroxylase (fatty acid hydroxylase superfamily)
MQSLYDIFGRLIERILNELHNRLIVDPLGFPFIEIPGDRLYLPYLISFIVISIGIYATGAKRTPGAQTGLGGFLKFMFPREIFLHKSATTDYKFYVINRLFGFLFLSWLGGVGIFAGVATAASLEALFGQVTSEWSTGAISFLGIVYFMATALAADLGRFLSHFLHHKSKFFWEFHKVHHSAEVLTPITNYRFHPAEKIMMSSITGITSGIVIGLFYFLFGESVKTPDFLMVTALNVGILDFAFRITSNHRHSHIWLSYGPVLEHVFLSPAQHVIHHSNEARHLDTNMGLLFSIWDWMAGTLYVPQGREEFSMGLQNGEHVEYHSVLRLYLLPIRKAFAVLTAGLKKSTGRYPQTETQDRSDRT